ncbi:MAG: hypothetical protein Q9171_002908 [Xanthocarpia ochracea]
MEAGRLKYRLTLEQSRSRQFEAYMTQLSTHHKATVAAMDKLQEQCVTLRSNTQLLEAVVAKKKDEANNERCLRVATQQQLVLEREYYGKTEARLDRSMATITQLGSALHLVLVDLDNTSEAEKEELKTFNYAEVVMQRDTFEVDCAQLRSILEQIQADRHARGSAA